MTDITDKNYLLHALALANLRRGFCAPNPAVGAVVVKNNQIIAEGFHQQAGMPHAEVEALKNLSVEQCAGATLYVSLEPCCHFGRTPPCTHLIMEKKLSRVVFGFLDPNPVVAGKGQQELVQAGIQCDYFPLAEITDFYQSWAWYCQHKMPFVTGKLALSLNGKIAGANGERLAITGESIKNWVHQQRLHSDAILTTAKTIVNDDPLLNVRLPQNTLAKPLYILDRQLQTPLTAKIFSTGASLCFFYETSAKENVEKFIAQGARCVAVSSEQGGLNLREILAVIAKEGYYNLWLEAGGACFTSFVQQKLMNKAFLAMGFKWLPTDAQDAFDQNIFAQCESHRWFTVGDEAVCEIVWPIPSLRGA